VREALRREISIIEERQRHESLLEDDAIREVQEARDAHCKKRLSVFPSQGGMSLTKLSLARNNLNFPGQGEFGK
jgi:hypothetical protein